MAADPESPAAPSPDTHAARVASLKTALASTATRTLALYFSRPVRLFRPSKISGWHSLGGQPLPPLIKQHGWSVIPRHFLPPLAVNALLGTVLWATYAETAARLTTTTASWPPTATAALSGGCAGAVQALAAAPAENVRLVLEGGRARGSWAVAWREVFAGSTEPGARADAREVRRWLRETRDMAGRGWHGLGFGVAKDACAFAAFFAIFDMSRHTAAAVSEYVAGSSGPGPGPGPDPGPPTATARIVHSTAIVAGGLVAGLAYELVCRPFDAARRLVHGGRAAPRGARSVWRTLLATVRADGMRPFFQPDPTRAVPSSSSSSSSSSHAWLRTLGRIGPWGVAFLVWASFGPEMP